MSDEFSKFDVIVRKVLTVSREELQKREAEWKRDQKKKKISRSKK